MGICTFLHQIPCWELFCKLLQSLPDRGIHDLLSEAWNNGTCVEWRGDDSDGGIGHFQSWNEEKETDEITKNEQSKLKKYSNEYVHSFTIALRSVYKKLQNGEYENKNINQTYVSGGKYGKFWKIVTNGNSYAVTFGKCGTNGITQTKQFANETECVDFSRKQIKAKLKKKYKLSNDGNNEKSNDDASEGDMDYLEIAKLIDQYQKIDQLQTQKMAALVHKSVECLGEDVSFIIACYCNEDRMDHYSCDKAFDDIGCPKTPICRLMDCVKSKSDKQPSAFDTHLCQGLLGEGMEFGGDVCYGPVRMFSPNEMKRFASRMVIRLIAEDDSSNNDLERTKLCRLLFDCDDFDSKNGNEFYSEMQPQEPPIKKRKLDTNNDNKKNNSEDIHRKHIVFNDEVLYKLSYWLSASGIWDYDRQQIVWEKIFLMDPDEAPQDTYEGNHSLCALSFALNAAATNHGVLVHYW